MNRQDLIALLLVLLFWAAALGAMIYIAIWLFEGE